MSEPSPTGQVSDERPVLVERRGHVMVITINRPGARNAVNEAVCLGVGDALEEAGRIFGATRLRTLFDAGVWIDALGVSRRSAHYFLSLFFRVGKLLLRCLRDIPPWGISRGIKSRVSRAAHGRRRHNARRMIKTEIAPGAGNGDFRNDFQ